jgi:hypothetical protein
MTPEDYANELSDCLRRKGMHLHPADLTAFVADIPPRTFCESNVEAMVERFIEAQEAHIREARKAKAARLALTNGLDTTVVAGAGAMVAAGVWTNLVNRLNPYGGGWSLALYLLVGIGFLTTAGAAVFGAVRAVIAYTLLARIRRARGG